MRKTRLTTRMLRKAAPRTHVREADARRHLPENDKPPIPPVPHHEVVQYGDGAAALGRALPRLPG